MTCQVYLVLPKVSSYMHKSIDTKRNALEQIIGWVDRLKDKGMVVNCFAEDMLALSLLSWKEGIKWHSIVNKSDYNFIIKTVKECAVEYKSINKAAVSQGLLKEALQKYKVRRVEEYGEQVAYLTARQAILNNRVRFVADTILNEASFVVYIDANNNFCSYPVTTIGDGKTLVTVDLRTGLCYYVYGGIPLRKKEFDCIMGGI